MTALATPPAEPGARGTLTVADRVVERIAAQAASEVDSAGGAPRRLSARTVAALPSVRARVDGDVAVLDMTLSVPWPAPVAAVTDEVRQHVVAVLDRLAGVRAVQVDIVVDLLTTDRADRRRVI